MNQVYMMKKTVGLLIVWVWIMGLSAYAAEGKYDYARQKELYTFSDFSVAKSRGALILIDVKDKRSEREKLGGLMDDQTIDSDYPRPLQDMLSDILVREMQHSGLIKLIPATRENYEYTMTVEILSFYAGTSEIDSGRAVKDWFVPRNAVATVTLKVIVKDRAGKEIMEVDFNGTSELEMARLTNYHKGAIRSAGMALKEVMTQLLDDLDTRLKARK